MASVKAPGLTMLDVSRQNLMSYGEFILRELTRSELTKLNAKSESPSCRECVHFFQQCQILFKQSFPSLRSSCNSYPV